MSVIIPTRDRAEMLDRCLTSVRAALSDRDELVVVDSASVDAAAVADVAAKHDARLVRCELPGVDRARNAGWTTTSNEILLFTDDDVTVDTKWAAAFTRCFADHPEAAFITGWIGAPSGQRHRWEVALKTDEQPAVLDRRSRGVLGHSASLGVRRSVLALIGGFDEQMGAGSRFRASPEADLFDRLFSAGQVGRFEPSARAWHDQWREHGDIVQLHFNYGTGAGARMAKLVRTDRQRFRFVARENLWSWGLASLGIHLRHADVRWVVVDLARMAGYVAGFARAIRAKVDNGHFAP